DVKFQSTPTRDETAAEQGDFYHWAATLRSVSGFEVYRKIYRNVITPTRVAELLILRSDMPRSLLASMDEVVAILSTVRN
ncbi:alpha-E domain-containing protein, partial [Staphylococcus aureus]